MREPLSNSVIKIGTSLLLAGLDRAVALTTIQTAWEEKIINDATAVTAEHEVYHDNCDVGNYAVKQVIVVLTRGDTVMVGLTVSDPAITEVDPITDLVRGGVVDDGFLQVLVVLSTTKEIMHSLLSKDVVGGTHSGCRVHG